MIGSELVSLTRTYPRLWSIDVGVVMVVTDLHGDWDSYCRYRDRFVDLHSKDQAHYLVLTGDLIHADAAADSDGSLEMVLDVLALQSAYGDATVYVCGNHELPHIYGFGLSKGEQDFTPAFERALTSSHRRREVEELFHSLPFYIRTAAGVSVTHAGAAKVLTKEEAALSLFGWDHREQLKAAEKWLEAQDVEGLRRAYARLSGAESYEVLARHYLAVQGAADPRYDDLLRGMAVTMSEGFEWLRSALFTLCEQEYGLAGYESVLESALRNMSMQYASQRVLVAGHMSVNNGYEVVARRHLRLASGSHAGLSGPRLYLLCDAERRVNGAEDLLAGLHSVYSAT